jgi:hypothetical protein
MLPPGTILKSISEETERPKKRKMGKTKMSKRKRKNGKKKKACASYGTADKHKAFGWCSSSPEPDGALRVVTRKKILHYHHFSFFFLPSSQKKEKWEKQKKGEMGTVDIRGVPESILSAINKSLSIDGVYQQLVNNKNSLLKTYQ